jgi:hypothetical protein
MSADWSAASKTQRLAFLSSLRRLSTQGSSSSSLSQLRGNLPLRPFEAAGGRNDVRLDQPSVCTQTVRVDPTLARGTLEKAGAGPRPISSTAGCGPLAWQPHVEKGIVLDLNLNGRANDAGRTPIIRIHHDRTAETP